MAGEFRHRELQTRPDPPSAIVAANNVMALGALQAINDLSFRCPADISIVGIDDVPWGGLVRPRVTTAVQPVKEIAGVAIASLLERIAAGADRIAPRTQIFVPAMIIGGSCASPKARDDRRPGVREDQRVRRGLD